MRTSPGNWASLVAGAHTSDSPHNAEDVLPSAPSCLVFADGIAPFHHVLVILPGGWETSVAEVTRVPSHVLTAFRRVAVLRALRPDRVTAAASAFVQSVLGGSFLSLPDATLEALVQVL